MKRTTQININGILFYIDEDAYEKLQDYLLALRKKFKDSDEGTEIIQDVEARIAELFASKVTDYKQVISLDDVENIIQILGQPEDFYNDEEDTHEKHKKPYKTSQEGSKRLYRDPDNALLAGICAGIAAYFKTDPVFIRIALIILTFLSAFSIIVVYLVLWFIIPNATSTAQKLEMRGERVTIENIEKTIKKEYDNVKENFRRFRKSKDFNRTKEAAHNATVALTEVFKLIFRIVAIVIGFAFVIAGLVIIFFTSSLVLFKTTIFTGYLGLDIFPFNDFLALFIHADNIQLFKIGLLLVIFIPLLSIIVGGMKLMLGTKSRNPALGIGGFVLWFLGLIIVVAVLFIESQGLSYEGQTQKTYFIEYSSNKPLTVNLDESMYKQIDRDGLFYDHDNKFIVQMSTDAKIFVQPELDITKSEGDKAELIIKCSARGENREDAQLHAKMVNYNFSVNKNTLSLPPYFTLQQGKQYRMQEMEIILKVPAGTKMIISRDIDPMLDNLYYTNNASWWDLIDNLCIMTDEGLDLAE